MAALMLVNSLGNLRNFALPRNVPTNFMAYSTNSNSEVRTEKRHNAGIITLDRPNVLNSLNLNMIRTIYPKLKGWENSGDINSIIIKGIGKAFCAGGDIKALYDAKMGITDDKTIMKEFFKEEYILNHAIGNCKIPYIALIDGITMGGGVGLSVHGKYRVATERTILAMPETHIGLFPDVGGGYFLSRLKNHLGAFLALTGHRLKGPDVFHAGIATHYVHSGDIDNLEDEISKANNLEDIEEILRSYHKSTEHISPFSLEPHLEMIDHAFGQPTVEEVLQELKKDNSEFALKQLNAIESGSPSSVKVTFAQLKNGIDMDLAKVLRMEYRLSQGFMSNNDFFEGVRAMLIDKCGNPKWEPPTFDTVTQTIVDQYFAHLPEHRELHLKPKA